MRGRNYNTGLRGVLFDSRHYARMGQAVWLFGWLVLRETRERDGIGFVLGGRPVTYREIEEETGFARKSLERWMRVLRRGGYIETTTAPGGVIVRILKAKKFARDAPNSGPKSFQQETRETRRSLWKSPAGNDPLLNFADAPLNNEGKHPQICAASPGHESQNAPLAAGIGNREVERHIEKKMQVISSSQNTERRIPSALVSRQSSRAEEISRELRAGAGPEVRR